jgi:hypothetical protein
MFVTFLLFSSSAIALAQHCARATETQQPELPCQSHPVNGRICVGEDVLYSFLLKPADLKLQYESKSMERSGIVLHLVVAKNGKPTRISVVSGDPALARRAVRSVRKWLFKPYLYNGEYVEMESDVRL